MLTLVIATRNAHKVGEIRAILGPGFHCLSLADFSGAPEVVEDAGSFAGNATKKAVALAGWLAHVQPGALARIFQAGSDASPRRPCGSSSGRLGEASLPAGLSVGEFYVLADDSGLEVDALGGAPGVHSARFAALDTGQPGNSPTADNNAKLLRLLTSVPPEKRAARFRCVLALTPVPSPAAASASPVCLADEVELQTELFEGTCEGRIAFEPRGTGGFGYDPLFIPQGHDLTLGELSEEVKNGLSHRARALALLRAKFVD